MVLPSHWNAAHTATLSGIASSSQGGTGNAFTAFTGPTTVEKTFTLPNADATLAHGVVGANTVALGSATGALSASLLTYNATYTGLDGSKLAHPSFLMTASGGAGLACSYISTSHLTSLPLVQFRHLVEPTQNSSANRSTLMATGGTSSSTGFNVGAITMLDAFGVHASNTEMLAGVAVSGWFAVTGASASVNAAGAIIGGIFTANIDSTATSASVPLAAGVIVNMTNGITWGAAPTEMNGLRFEDVNVNNSKTITTRKIINILATTGNAATNDWAIHSAAIQRSRFSGQIGIVGGALNTFTSTSSVLYDTDLYSSITRTSQSSNTAAGSVSEFTYNMTSGSPAAQNIYGSIGLATIAATDDRTYSSSGVSTSLVGAGGIALYAGTTGGSMPIVQGIIGVGQKGNSAGTIGTKLVGAGGITVKLDSTTVPLTASLYASRGVQTGGTTTLSAALYLESGILTGGTTTQGYGIYQSGTGATEKNYFGAGLWIGNATVTRATTQPTNHINLTDGIAPAGAATNTVTVYSGSGKLKTCDAAGLVAHIVAASATNSVSPTAPNRTLTADVGGTTLYIHCKTTND